MHIEGRTCPLQRAALFCYTMAKKLSPLYCCLCISLEPGTTDAKAIEDDYRKAIESTLNSASFESVLNGLYFLKDAQDKYNPPRIDKLDEIINLVKKARDESEIREMAQKEGKDKAKIEAQAAAEASTTT